MMVGEILTEVQQKTYNRYSKIVMGLIFVNYLCMMPFSTVNGSFILSLAVLISFILGLLFISSDLKTIKGMGIVLFAVMFYQLYVAAKIIAEVTVL